jgi:hypothetical protein
VKRLVCDGASIPGPSLAEIGGLGMLALQRHEMAFDLLVVCVEDICRLLHRVLSVFCWLLFKGK